jgi:hypothetical protein
MPITRRPTVGPNGEQLMTAGGDDRGMAAPMPPAPEPTPAPDPATAGGGIRAAERPRDLAGPGANPASLAPSQPPGGGSQATPSRPMQPSPVAMGTPQPFTPLSNPDTTQIASTQPGGLASIMRRGIEPSPQGGALLGRAGGLLGGGLGVPGLGGSESNDLSSMISALFKMAAGGTR